MSAVQQTSEGHVRHLHGHAKISSSEVVFRADDIDFDEDRAVMHLNGHVTIEAKNKTTVIADEADYDVKSGDLRLKL
jgi:lipopolysaccharide assembly outer membrane protein LptD (OstA)